VARRYGVLLFNKELIESWKSPYRRAIMVAALDIKTDERIIAEYMLRDLPSIMKNLSDAVATSIINAVLSASVKKFRETVRTIFRKRRLFKPDEINHTEP